MRNRKKYFGMLLAVAVAFAGIGGCGNVGGGAAADAEKKAAGEGSAGNTAGRGRYIEQETSFPEGAVAYAMEKLDDGTIRVFGLNEGVGYAFFDSADGGENWERTEVTFPQNKYFSAAAVSTSGTVAAVYSEYEGETWKATQVLLPAVGKDMGPITLNFPEKILSSGGDYAGLVTDCAFDEAGNFFVLTLKSHLLQVDLSTGECIEIADLEDLHATSIEIAGHWIFGLSSKGVRIFDSRDGSEGQEDSFFQDLIAGTEGLGEKNTDFGTNLVIEQGADEDSYFYVTHEGLFAHNLGGGISEQLINGALNTMGDTSQLFGELVRVDDEHFLLSMMKNGVTTILKYSYDKEAPAVPETELKVYALNDSQYLRQVMSAYQRAQRDTYVNLTVGMTGTDGVTAEDAIRALNTDILAGKGPDVLILDGLPVDSYIEKGVLADIGGLVDEIRGTVGVFENVAKAYVQDGAVYAFPAKFYVMLVGGTADAVEAGATLQGIADYVATQEKKFPQTGARDLLKNLYPGSSANFIRDGKLNENEIAYYLKQAKRLYEPGEYDDMVATYGGPDGSGLIGNFSAIEMLLGESCLAHGAMVDTEGLILELAAEKQGDFTYALARREEAKCFVPYQLAGIGSGTAHREAAEEFLRTLFGVQCGSMNGNGFPVNRAAYESLCEETMRPYADGEQGGIVVSTSDGMTLSLDFSKPTEDEMAKLTGILEDVDTPAFTDRVIEEIVLEYGEAVLKGDLAVDEAVASIRKKCDLYLAE